MLTFSDRLRAERTRLGLSQTDFSALGGVGREAQVNYEKGARSPDVNYLTALIPHGVDVHFLLTGVPQIHAGKAFAEHELRLLDGFHRMDDAARAAVMLIIESLAQTSGR